MVVHVFDLGGAEGPSFLIELLEDIARVFEARRFQLIVQDSRQYGVE